VRIVRGGVGGCGVRALWRGAGLRVRLQKRDGRPPEGAPVALRRVWQSLYEALAASRLRNSKPPPMSAIPQPKTAMAETPVNMRPPSFAPGALRLAR